MRWLKRVALPLREHDSCLHSMVPASVGSTTAFSVWALVGKDTGYWSTSAFTLVFVAQIYSGSEFLSLPWPSFSVKKFRTAVKVSSSLIASGMLYSSLLAALTPSWTLGQGRKDISVFFRIPHYDDNKHWDAKRTNIPHTPQLSCHDRDWLMCPQQHNWYAYEFLNFWPGCSNTRCKHTCCKQYQKNTNRRRYMSESLPTPDWPSIWQWSRWFPDGGTRCFIFVKLWCFIFLFGVLLQNAVFHPTKY